MKMQITNNSRALQGVHSTAGLVFIEAGATQEVDVAQGYAERVKALPFFGFGGEGTTDDVMVGGRDGNGDTAEMAELRHRFDGAWARLSAEHEAGKAALATANEEIGALKTKVADLERENEVLIAKLAAAALDHDGDGKPGGAAANDPPSERDTLKARATELKLEFAKNISTDKLKDLVRDAELDAMTDTELKTFLGTKGVTTADETRDQLIELAKAA